MFNVGSVLIFLLIFGNFADFCQGETTKILLRVKKGTDVSFIDLWNMQGFCTNDEDGMVYRSGIIDINFTGGCPSKMYFLLGDVFSLYFSEPFENSLNWLTNEASGTHKSIPIKSIRTKLGPGQDVIFNATKIDGNQPNLYFVVYYLKDGTSIYPKYYAIQQSSHDPVFGKFQDCSLTDSCQTISENEIKSKLNEQTTTTTKSTTTEPATTTTAEDTTTQHQTEISSGEEITSSNSKQTETTTNSAEKMCPCDCEYKRRLDLLNTKSDIPIEELRAMLEPEIQSIKKSLTVDVDKLASTKRKKKSADDARKSAEQIGAIGAIILGIVFGLLVLIDLLSIRRYWQTFRRNFLQVF